MRYARSLTLAVMCIVAGLWPAFAGTAFQKVWYPDGVINWFIDDVTNAGANGVNIRNAMTFLASRTPLRITEVTTKAAANLTFSKAWTLGSGAGMTAFYWQQDRKDKNRVIELSNKGTVSTKGVVHEVGHALGMAHEFQRPERDDFVSMCPLWMGEFWNGVNYEKVGHWPLLGTHWNLSPYDWFSIMSDSYTCQTPKPTPSGFVPTSSAPDRLSIHDVNSIYRMYADKLGQHAEGNLFGHAVATGDFDGDGIKDIAVASTHFRPDVGQNELMVNFFKGVMTDPYEEHDAGTSYVPWFSEHAAWTTEPSPRLVLASGDFNGDGIDDLAVGQPFHTGGRGGVAIWFVNAAKDIYDSRKTWGKHTIRWVYAITPESVGLTGPVATRFGSSIASGRFTARYNESLPPVVDDLVVGAPKAMLQKSGAVVFIQGMKDPTAVAWAPVATRIKSIHGAADGDGFGSAVSSIPGMCKSTGSFDKDVAVVGAPGENKGRGAIYVLGCAGDDAGALVNPDVVHKTSFDQAGARFGAAVAGFRTRSSANTAFYHYYVATGAPRYSGGTPNLDTGRVYLQEFDRQGTKTDIANFTPSGGAGHDEFGATVAVQQTPVAATTPDGSREVSIAVGMPGAVVGGKRSGKVIIWQPWTSMGEINNVAAATIDADRPSTTSSTRFGEALSVLRDREDHGGFVIGAPQAVEFALRPGLPPLVRIFDPVSTGAIDVVLNNVAGAWRWQAQRRHLTQESRGDRRPTN